MRRTAVGILLAGFVFIFFIIPFMGIDLLIDAVGFLLLFNGARALQKIGRAEAEGLLPGTNTGLLPPASFGFGAAQPLAIILVGLSAVQLFVGVSTGMASGGGIIGIARAVLEILLFLSLLRGFGPFLKNRGLKVLGLAVPIALLLDMAAGVLSILAILFLFVAAPFLFAVNVAAAIIHLFTLAVFIWLLVAVGDGKRTPKGQG